MVAPATRLFRGSIIENLTLFGTGADVKDVMSVVAELNLDKTLNTLPKGYETQVGAADSGDATLPPELHGQIALARALAHMPRLLLLDRPFAYIENGEQRARLVDLLGRMRAAATILLQSNEPDFERIADARIEVSNGLCAIKPLRPAETEA